jgi:hypothetical protein
MTYSQLVTYFEAVAENHKQIKHSNSAKRFFGIDLSDLINSLKDIGSTPCIGLERPFYSTGGQHANVRLIKNGAIMIFDRYNDPTDFALIEGAYDKCYTIAQDIIAKMIKDAKSYDEDAEDYILPGLNPSTFSVEPMPLGFGDGGLTGVRLSFQFDEAQELFDVTKWDDEDDFEV